MPLEVPLKIYICRFIHLHGHEPGTHPSIPIYLFHLSILSLHSRDSHSAVLPQLLSNSSKTILAPEHAELSPEPIVGICSIPSKKPINFGLLWGSPVGLWAHLRIIFFPRAPSTADPQRETNLAAYQKPVLLVFICPKSINEEPQGYVDPC